MTEQEFLQNYDITQYDRPSVTTDVVLFALDKTTNDIRHIAINGLQILLIKRASHPYKDKWALPGGFCKPNESIYQTAKRELKEETNVNNIALKLIGTYSDRFRDPRGWIISNAFMGMTPKESCQLRADTDAWDAAWFTIQNYQALVHEKVKEDVIIQNIRHMFQLASDTENIWVNVLEIKHIYPTHTEIKFRPMDKSLAFDHAQIICETYLSVRNTLKHDIRMLFNLFPETFTIGELQKAYEVIQGQKVQNFRRSIQNYVQKTDIVSEKTGYRPAKLYARNIQTFSRQETYM